MVLGPLTNEIFENILNELKKDEIKNKINICLLDPILEYMKSRLFPYLQFLGILIGFIIVLLLVILIVILRK